MPYDLVIKNGTVVTSCETIDCDVGVTGERVTDLGSGLSGKKEIDAAGKLVIPGGVDIHVHMEMPAGEHTSCDDFFDGTKAAAFGGTTTIIDFVEPEPDEPLLKALENRRAQADPKVVIDYGLHMTIGPPELEKLRQISEITETGVRSFKVYTAYDFRLHDGQLFEAFEAVREAGGTAVGHAENQDIIRVLTDRCIAEGKTGPEWHPECRPAVFEGEAVNRVIAIAGFVGVPVHIFHVSCRDAAEKISEARKQGIAVTGETCPQYLFLDKKLYTRPDVEGALPICSPPLRTQPHREYLWDSLGTGGLQTVSTDHCPFTKEAKRAGMARFDRIPGGLPSIEVRLASIYSGGVHTGRISLQQWVALCCTAPAQIVGLEKKGDIAPGCDADLVIFDPERETKITTDFLHETAGWTPYEGSALRGWPEKVFSRGELIVDKGRFTGNPGRGKYI